MPLTPKQQRFVEEYLIDLNASRAYRDAYSLPGGKPVGEGTAKVNGSRLLTRADVQEAIARARAEQTQRTQVTADRVVNELAVIAFSDLRHYQLDDQGHVQLTHGAPESAMRSISAIRRRVRRFRDKNGGESIEYDTEIRLWPKHDALQQLGRHTGVDQPAESDEQTQTGLELARSLREAARAVIASATTQPETGAGDGSGDGPLESVHRGDAVGEDVPAVSPGADPVCGGAA